MGLPFNFGKLQMKKDTSPALVLNITERVVNNVLHYDIVIVEQQYRNENFNHGSSEFTASNGFVLGSVSCPAGTSINDGACTSTQQLYVRGTNRACDNDTITVDGVGWVANLKVAVKEYNEHVTK